MRGEIIGKEMEADLATLIGDIEGIASREENLRVLETTMKARKQLLKSFHKQIQMIADLGCHLKGIEPGLVDFPTVRDEETVYLCWREGEEAIGFWHTLDGGFTGRQPLDEEFE